MLTVHHLNNSRSQRVLWLLEELNLNYEIKHYQRNPKTMLAPASLKKVHPLGKSPLVTDGNIVLAESGAIIDYLVNRYGNGKLKPKSESPDALRYSYWLHYAEGSAIPPFIMKLVFDRLEKSPMPFFIRPVVKGMAKKVGDSYIHPQITSHLDYIEDELSKSSWFAGDHFSAADIQMSFPIEVAAAQGGLGKEYTNLKKFLIQIHERPPYQIALEKGGPYDIIR